MFAGFDYGTSHCSLGVMRDSQVHLAPVDADATLIASTLWAPRINLGFSHDDEERLDMSTQAFRDLRFGEAALAAYLQDPTQGYFVKSPKSFLGAPGLSDEVKARFVSIVAAMMGNVRTRAGAAFGADIEQVVIGRPVNFQGPQGNVENDQALTMLTAAAQEAGFDEVNFLFEPMAAAMEYEARLAREQRVLVVDVGGGTTDCSFVQVGPQRMRQSDRVQDVIGHVGERMGGNDYDQALALQAVMPLFGFGSELLSDLPVPNNYLVDAVSTNDVNAQQRFYSSKTAERLDYFVRESRQPERLRRLTALHYGRATYRLLREVEMGKIALSDKPTAVVDLEFVEPGLVAQVEMPQFTQACERLLDHLQRLVNDVLAQSQAAPDVVYLTGGMSKSVVVRQCLQTILPDTEQVDSDHFASVTEGLTLWAQRLYAR